HQLHAYDMVKRAGSLVHDAEQILCSGCEQRTEKAQLALNLDGAIALAMLAQPYCREKHALHAAGSTIDGRMQLVLACLEAMAPVDGIESSELTRFQYRLKCAYERIKQESLRRLQSFTQDRERALANLTEISKILPRAISLRKGFTL